MTARPARIALVQTPPVFLNLGASLERALGLIAQAAGETDILVFPETWLPGYPVWIDEAPEAALWDHPGAKALYRILSGNAVAIGDTTLARLTDAAAKAKLYLVIGAHECRGGSLYNTMFFFAPDGSAAWHRKLVPTYTERLVWGMGDGSTLATLTTPFGTLGGLICWEHWMPLLRAAMHDKGEAIHIAQWPTVKEMHQVASRHYAFEGRCFVAASGTVLSKGDVLDGLASLAGEEPEARALLEAIPGPDDRLLQRGGSAVIAPDGSYVADPVHDRAETVRATLDLDRLAEERMTLDAAGHYSRPDIFTLHVDARAQANVLISDESGPQAPSAPTTGTDRPA
ncbi:MAG: carbon-nitrogen hydrolase family protein [Alphaproteobacteria bacterium]|nr:MAG: carbon-nitrogen hydrolase family protein [Alphaproteobacteria bacterium]